MIDMSACAVGTIVSAANATKIDSFSNMLLWSVIGALELIGTILKVIRVFV